jgi:hypothetical protein
MKKLFKVFAFITLLIAPVAIFAAEAAAPQPTADSFRAAISAQRYDLAAACLGHADFTSQIVPAADQAIKAGETAALVTLLAHGRSQPIIMESNFSDCVGHSVLHVAAQHGSAAAVSFLLSAYPAARINTVCGEGRTALSYAASRKADETHQGSDIVSQLLAKGAERSLTIPDADGSYPLHLAEDLTTIDLLLNAYVPLYSQSTRYGTKPFADLLDAKNKSGETAFSLAVSNAQWEKVSKILEHAYSNHRTITITRAQLRIIYSYTAANAGALRDFMMDQTKTDAVAKTDFAVVYDAVLARAAAVQRNVASVAYQVSSAAYSVLPSVPTCGTKRRRGIDKGAIESEAAEPALLSPTVGDHGAGMRMDEQPSVPVVADSESNQQSGNEQSSASESEKETEEPPVVAGRRKKSAAATGSRASRIAAAGGPIRKSARNKKSAQP